MSTLASFTCIAILAFGVYHYLPQDHPGRLFRLEQFCSAAPLAGLLDDDGRGDRRPNADSDPAPTDRSSDSTRDRFTPGPVDAREDRTLPGESRSPETIRPT
ncbi:hypothetical protein [Prescottella subtropica]|uniref:hypothetical protein n=1 Tax=Prescottella subtropica TaxID=2545757 RepID=UPI0010FA149B|nr:hypothetical protein [Prescottella subtropica]